MSSCVGEHAHYFEYASLICMLFSSEPYQISANYTVRFDGQASVSYLGYPVAEGCSSAVATVAGQPANKQAECCFI